MAAYIVKMTPEEAKVMADVMGRINQGAILITPEQDTKLKAAGIDIEDGTLVDYDFGGEADILLDRLNFCSVDAILDHLAIADHDFDEEKPEESADAVNYGSSHEKIKQQILGEPTDGEDDN